MNFSDVLKSLNRASAFELYRMRAAIDRVLDEPRWLLAIQARLQVGQTIEYFDAQANASRHGKVLELRRKQAVILDQDDGKRWLISYVSINLDGADVQIREQSRQGLGRMHTILLLHLPNNLRSYGSPAQSDEMLFINANYCYSTGRV